MPLTPKGKKVMAKMRKTYGEHAEEVFYAMMNKMGHKEQQYHHSPGQYDDSALGETPPRIKFQVVQEGLGAGGAESNRIPAAVQKADGTENIRAEGQTKTSTRAKAGNGTTRYPAIDRFSGENV